jgi:hypothetical protein
VEAELTGALDSIEIPMMGVADHWSAAICSRQLLDFLHAGGKVAGLSVAPELPLWQSSNPSAEFIKGEPAFLPLQSERPVLGVTASAT